MRKFILMSSFVLLAAPAFAHGGSPSVGKTFSIVTATGGSVASSGASLNATNENEQSSAENHGFSTTTVGANRGTSEITTISKDSGNVSSGGNGFASANESGSAETAGQTFGFSAGRNFGF